MRALDFYYNCIMCYHPQNYRLLTLLWKKDKSFMNILKRRGPRIDPCGTTVLISHHELKDEPIFVLCFQLVR